MAAGYHQVYQSNLLSGSTLPSGVIKDYEGYQTYLGSGLLKDRKFPKVIDPVYNGDTRFFRRRAKTALSIYPSTSDFGFSNPDLLDYRPRFYNAAFLQNSTRRKRLKKLEPVAFENNYKLHGRFNNPYNNTNIYPKKKHGVLKFSRFANPADPYLKKILRYEQSLEDVVNFHGGEWETHNWALEGLMQHRSIFSGLGQWVDRPFQVNDPLDPGLLTYADALAQRSLPNGRLFEGSNLDPLGQTDPKLSIFDFNKILYNVQEVQRFNQFHALPKSRQLPSSTAKYTAENYDAFFKELNLKAPELQEIVAAERADRESYAYISPKQKRLIKQREVNPYRNFKYAHVNKDYVRVLTENFGELGFDAELKNIAKWSKNLQKYNNTFIMSYGSGVITDKLTRKSTRTMQNNEWGNEMAIKELKEVGRLDAALARERQRRKNIAKRENK